MKKIILLLTVFSIVFSIPTHATKSEKELSKLYLGIHIKDVEKLYGEPSFSKYDKETNTRMLLYYFYKHAERGTAEYHLYFLNDSLIDLMLYADKTEVRQKLEGAEDVIVYKDKDAIYPIIKDYTIEGKSLVIT